MQLFLKVWRQKDSDFEGKMVDYALTDVMPELSFLEMLDILNEELLKKGEDPIAFDHDCREGICGMCSLYINGRPHGPEQGITACQLHIRSFKDGDTIYIEPWRAKPFKVLKDLIVDRTALDRIMQAGGYISINTGSAPDANAIAISREKVDEAFESADCIGCGACIAVCKNASAMLFVAAKVSHLALLPQGQMERKTRALNMIAQMDKENFGTCTNTGACAFECPKSIPLSHIARLNREYLVASLTTD
ncbi:MAG: succinate dehydrogenase/fumarate reductase iron-sulfur subunit [Thiomargarita sp.]|nr:succinate dehydrogenase/fumarate reductase iron-sulfur subunit [Thiomargarita sp.]